MSKGGIGLEITELRLGLPGATSAGTIRVNEKKRVFSEIESSRDEVKDERSGKSQAVGWPPVCSYRKKNVSNGKMYVKVSMDGAPFLRKIDLSSHEGYGELAFAFEKLFHACYDIGQVLKDWESSEYIPIYEDKDGDWMLVGDVPWKMFVESCKRLRIMKKSDAKGFELNLKKIVNRPYQAFKLKAIISLYYSL